MTDYKEKFDDLQRAARRKAREIDEKLNVTGRVEDTARVAGDAARRGAQTIADGAEQLRAEAAAFADENNLRENAGKAVDEAKRRAKDAGKVIRDAAGPAGKKAEKAFNEAVDYATTATKFAGKGVRATRATAAATAGLMKAKDWVKENPGKAAAVSFSLILGVRLGASFPGIDAVLLGSHPHWLTHSALPVLGLKKASEKFDEYLKKQEARIAAGAVMFAQIANPVGLTGAPISMIFGGNPFLDGVWLFANGVICFHQGYKFFMIALANQEEVNRVVREIKGLLPSTVSG